MVEIYLIYNIAENTHRIAAKKPSNKSCSALNFVQKSPPRHMSISPQSGASGLKKFIKRKVR